MDKIAQQAAKYYHVSSLHLARKALALMLITASGVVAFTGIRATGQEKVDVVVVQQPEPAQTANNWAANPDVQLQGGQNIVEPGSVDITLGADIDAVNTYVNAVTHTNSGARTGVLTWSKNVKYHINLPATYPAGIADEIRSAYRWMSETTGVTITETGNLKQADIEVKGHLNNGGLTIYDAGATGISNVTIQIGCCRRSVIWEEVAHSMGLISDTGPPGSAVARYEDRENVNDVISPYDATVLKALYHNQLTRESTDEQVKDAIVKTATQ